MMASTKRRRTAKKGPPPGTDTSGVKEFSYPELPREFKKDPAQASQYGGFGRRGTVFTGLWLELAQAYGGVQALADQVGVSYSTLHRWAVLGGVMLKPARTIIIMLASQKGLQSPVSLEDEPAEATKAPPPKKAPSEAPKPPSSEDDDDFGLW